MICFICFQNSILFNTYLRCLYCCTSSSCASISTFGLNILANWRYRDT